MIYMCLGAIRDTRAGYMGAAPRLQDYNTLGEYGIQLLPSQGHLCIRTSGGQCIFRIMAWLGVWANASLKTRRSACAHVNT